MNVILYIKLQFDVRREEGVRYGKSMRYRWGER